MTKLEELIRDAEREAAAIGFIPPKPPDWHPYYWAGFKAALEKVKALGPEIFTEYQE